MRNVILFSLMLFIFAACTEQLIDSDDSSLSKVQLNKKPVKPPPPPPPAPMPALDPGTKYIAATTDGMVFIWELDGNNLTCLWSGSIEADMINSIAIGDFNGGSKELFVERSITRGKGSKSIKSQELLIFTEGDTEPSEIIVLRTPADAYDAVWDMKVANVDHGPELEIVIQFRDALEVWEYNGISFVKSASTPFDYSDFPSGIGIGNIDNDDANEIIVARFPNTVWRSYKYDGSSISPYIESYPYKEYNVFYPVKIADINNDGKIEVIGGSHDSTIVVWREPYINETDIDTSLSLELPNNNTYIWALDVGDIDGDPLNGKEIICGATLAGGLHLFKYDVNGFDYRGEVVPDLSVRLDGIIVSENDQKIFVATATGLKVFDYQFNLLYDTGTSLGDLIYQ